MIVSHPENGWAWVGSSMAEQGPFKPEVVGSTPTRPTMNDINCDICNKVGVRPLGKTCPEGWMYGEMTDESTGHIYILVSCSNDCRASFWKPQTTLEESLVHLPDSSK